MKIKMKTSMLAILAMSSVAGAANAAVSVLGDENNGVQVYGVLDVAYGKVDHQAGISSQFPASVNPYSAVASTGASKVTGSTTGFFNGGISGDRVGVKGAMDLPGSLKGFFTLEEGINITTFRLSNGSAAIASGSGATLSNDAAETSVDNQLFNRQAFVGVSYDKLGSVAVGRNYAPIFDIAVVYDPVQNANLFSPLGFSGGIGGGGGISADMRVEKSLKYSNKIGSFNFGGLYKYAGSVGDRAKSGYGLNAGYVEGNFGIQAAYESFTDALKGALSTTAGDVAVTAYNTSAYMIAANYKINNAATVKIGYESYTLSAPSDHITSASYYGQAISSTTPFSHTDQENHVAFIGGDYNFTEKFNLAAGMYDVRALQSSDANQLTNDARYYSLLADYHFTKTLDTYAGLMNSNFSGGKYITGYYNSNNIIAIGGRYKF